MQGGVTSNNFLLGISFLSVNRAELNLSTIRSLQRNAFALILESIIKPSIERNASKEGSCIGQSVF